MFLVISEIDINFVKFISFKIITNFELVNNNKNKTVIIILEVQANRCVK